MSKASKNAHFAVDGSNLPLSGDEGTLLLQDGNVTQAPFDDVLEARVLAVPTTSLPLGGTENVLVIQNGEMTQALLTQLGLQDIVETHLTDGSINAVFASIEGKVNHTSARTTTASGFKFDAAGGTFDGTFPSAETIFSHAIGPGTNPAKIYDALTVIFKNGAGQTVDLANGLGVYVVNDGGSTDTFPVPCVFNFVGINRKDNSSLWGINGILTDAYGQAAGAAIGRFLFNELDFNINNPNTSGTLLQLGINGTAQGSGIGGITWIGPGPYYFDACMSSQDHIAVVFANIGLQNAVGIATASQNVNWHFDAAQMTQGVLSGGTMVLASTGGNPANLHLTNGLLLLDDGKGIDVNSHLAVAGSGTAGFLFTDGTWANLSIGNASCLTSINGNVTFAKNNGSINLNYLNGASAQETLTFGVQTDGAILFANTESKPVVLVSSIRLPTSATGLPMGALWNNAGTITVV